MRYVDLLVHRNGLMGSLAVVSSMILPKALFKGGQDASIALRPPPGRRSLPVSPSQRFCLKSLIPFRIVGRDIPVNSCIAFKPPRPNAKASFARYQRACASFSV